MNPIGRAIKKRRLELKLTQDELGYMIGCKGPTIQRYECGDIPNIKYETLQKLASVMNVNLSALLDGANNATPTADDTDRLYAILRELKVVHSNGSIDIKRLDNIARVIKALDDMWK